MRGSGTCRQGQWNARLPALRSGIGPRRGENVGRKRRPILFEDALEDGSRGTRVVVEKPQLDPGRRKSLRLIQCTAAGRIDVTGGAEPACDLDDAVLPAQRVGQVERTRTDGAPRKPQTRDDLAEQPLEIVDRSSDDALKRPQDLGFGLLGCGEERYAAH